MTASSYSAPWRVRVLDAAAASSDPARNARAWAAGWTPTGYTLYAMRAAILGLDSASECRHIPQQTSA